MHIQLKEWKVSEGHELFVSKNEVNVPGFLMKYFPHPYTDDDAMNFVYFCKGFTGNELLFLVTVDGKVAGGAFLGLQGETGIKTAKIGYWIAGRYQGMGMSSWIVEQLSLIAFEEYDVVKIHVGLAAERLRSQYAAYKNGPSPDALLHQYVQKYGRVLEEKRFSVIRGETKVNV